MEIFDKITSDDLEVMGYKWAEHFFGDFSSDELKEFAYETFVNGFLAGAVQLRAIVEEFENKKEAE